MPAKFQVPLFYNFDDRYWTASVSANAEQVEEIDPIPHYSTVDFDVTFCAGGVATTLTSPDWTGGIKVKDDFSGTYLVQLSNPVLVGTIYTFTMLIDSTELRTALLSPQNQYAFEIHEATSGISTLVPIFFSISRSYTLTGASPSSANGTLVVAATKTVSFPLSLTFPSANGTNGFQLTTDGAGALTWAAGTNAPGGSTTQVQYNNAGSFAGITGATTNGTALTLVAPVLGAATATSINGMFISSSSGIEIYPPGSPSIPSIQMLNAAYTAGSINTNGGASAAGGGINTSNGGGTITTNANGSIGLGIVANRTYLVSTAGNNEKTATFPNVTGTVAVVSVTSTTLGSGATTLAVASIVVKLTGHASGNTIGTITGGISGMSLVIIFVDALVTITDTDASTANTVNLSASFTSSANDTLSLVYDGNKWFETARSVN